MDESDVNMRSGDHTHGWSKKGAKIPYKTSIKKGENFSILPAMNIDGYIACCVYKGAVNGDTFETFVEQELIPLCQPYPGPNSIIVMDNAAIHRAEVNW